jgi:hypothetical protein
MAYNVAQAEVTVTPNARGFGNELRTQISAEADAAGRAAGDRIVASLRERLKEANLNADVDVDTTKASAKVDEFLAKTKAKAAAAGDESGRAMGKNLADGAEKEMAGRSKLIVAAIAAGIMAGGPLMVAAGGGLMVALAAVIEHNQPEVEEAASNVGQAFSDAFGQAALVTVPYLVRALDTVKASAQDLADSAAPAFEALEWPIQSVTQGVIALAKNAMPGLTAAIRASTPTFDGLAHLLAQIGTGLGSMFQTLSQHGDALGTTLSSLGDALGAVVAALGPLLSAGAELGSLIMPPLAAVLQVLASVLQVIEPILPGIALGFLAWKAAAIIAPLLGTLAGQLDTLGIKALIAADNMVISAASADVAAAGFGGLATAARGAEAAMGPIGWVLLAVGAAVPFLISKLSDQDGMQKKVKASADSMRQALQQSKGAIDDTVRATAAKQAQDDGLLAMAPKWGVATSTIVDALLGNKDAMDQVTAAQKRYENGLSSQSQAAYQHVQDLQNSGQATTAAAMAAGTLSNKNDDLIRSSQEAGSAIGTLAGTTADEVKNQEELAAAIGGSADAAQRNAERLQGLANTAGAANSQINLLKGALDALTGKAVSLGDAQVAVTNATNAALQAMEGQKDEAGHLTSALTDANGHLDQTTAAGAAAWSSLTSLAGADNTLIATMEQHGATAEEVQKRDGELRDSFIQTAEKMGFSADEAKNLADQIYGIPDERNTEITADTKQASDAAAQLKVQLESIKDRKVTITVDQNGIVTGQWFGNRQTGVGMEAAGSINVKRYDTGGFNLTPNMSASVAKVVGPNTWRVIGDRTQDDEAFIPINSSARSLAILAQTAGRMGYGLADRSQPAGPGKTDARSYQFNISAPSDPRAIAAQIRDVQRDLEFLHG